MVNTYTPAEFIAKMAADELSQPAAMSIVGLAEYDQDKPDAIQFSSASCGQWLTLPTDMVESVGHLGSVPCNDHQHPLVKITFKQGDAARADLAFLFGLIGQMQVAIQRLSSASGGRKEGRRTLSADGGDCYTVIDNGKVFVCCGDPPECTGVAYTQ